LKNFRERCKGEFEANVAERFQRGSEEFLFETSDQKYIYWLVSELEEISISMKDLVEYANEV
jgi:hypothetical protein